MSVKINEAWCKRVACVCFPGSADTAGIIDTLLLSKIRHILAANLYKHFSSILHTFVNLKGLQRGGEE